MTQVGLIHLLSALYLSGVLCLAVSLNDNDRPRRIFREAGRRWIKFLGVALGIAGLVAILA